MAMRSSRLGSAAIRTRGSPCCRWVRREWCIEPHPAPEDRGAGPCVPPTTQDLCDALARIDPGASYEEVLEHLDQVEPPMAVAGSIDQVDVPPDPHRLRAIRRQFLGVLVDLEGLRERYLVDEDLQGLIHLVLTSEIMMGGPDIPQAV